MKYELQVEKRNENWGTLTVEKEGNKVCVIVKKELGFWELACFSYGKVGNTKYRQDTFTSKLYEKDGRGRESKVAKEKMKELYTLVNEIINSL